MTNEQNAIKETLGRADKAPEEILALAKEQGVELSDAQIDQISGGGWSGYYVVCSICGKRFGVEEDTTHVKCPHCGSMILAS